MLVELLSCQLFCRRVSVIKGRATTRDTTPLIGVTVAVLNEPAYGHTLTRLDGSYDIAVNGGSAITLTYNRRNFIGSQRSVVVPVNNYVSVDDIAMITVDTQVTYLLSSLHWKIFHWFFGLVYRSGPCRWQ